MKGVYERGLHDQFWDAVGGGWQQGQLHPLLHIIENGRSMFSATTNVFYCIVSPNPGSTAACNVQ